MAHQWMALVRQLCTPAQRAALEQIASARSASLAPQRTTAELAELARRFGLSSSEADAWARSASATVVRTWPRAALDLVHPTGLFQNIGLDETIAVLDRLSRTLTDEGDLASAV